ncbi:hypothetical protein Cri9333_4489 [Crinalium epipsammum PCC 9333]|uniref:Uncharacterized protein n=1 Tax=Crinalium epipsammum PCC 9333 TaxID=1173022 RepID=K9W719_9CYAN|nr:hypothetical protein [Crinalium epipsammum]AFZ15270.1 hypothetical protein Cri9333_4489 [Crinalium epipsammum PCC 9333]
MNVVCTTPNLLKLRERPIGIWLISVFTALLGMLIFISFDSPIDYFGFLCIIFSNLMMFGSPVQTCIFNKDLNYVTLKHKGWLGTKIIAYPIDEIEEIKIQESRFVGTQFYRICLILISGKKFYLTQVPSTDWKLQKKLVQYIRQFLSYSSNLSQPNIN